jgi:2,3-dihydroxyphenylpropionate 1,2-dioxygenase
VIKPAAGSVYAAFVPHLPFMEIQERALNAPFWAAYEAQQQRIRAFDPELVFVFGSDHYEGQLMRSMAPFMVGIAATAVPDRGGFPGPLNVPAGLARACADFLMAADFDIAVSHAMQIDHGFSQVLHGMLGAIDARPVVPLFINSLAQPRPALARVRRFGEAVGRYASTLGKRVAILGSGGLSHETGDIFPQIHETSDAALREFLIHGGERGPIKREQWRRQLHDGLTEVSRLLEARTPGVGQVRPAWDEQFLRLWSAGDLTVFDGWTDSQLLREGGNGAGEVRSWIAALAAAQVAGAAAPVVDYYAAGTAIGVAAVVAHASTARDQA